MSYSNNARLGSIKNSSVEKLTILDINLGMFLCAYPRDKWHDLLLESTIELDNIEAESYCEVAQFTVQDFKKLDPIGYGILEEMNILEGVDRIYFQC